MTLSSLPPTLSTLTPTLNPIPQERNQKFFKPNFFWNWNFFRPKIYLDSIFFGTSKFIWPWIFFRTKKLLDTKNFWLNFFSTQNLCRLKFFWNPQLFLTQNFFRSYIFLDLGFFQTKNFFRPPKFSESKYTLLVRFLSEAYK